MKQPGARRRRGKFHQLFGNDHGGTVFPLLKKRVGKAESGTVGRTANGQGPFEKCFRFGQTASGQNDLGDVLQERAVVGRKPQGGPEFVGNKLGIKWVEHAFQLSETTDNRPSKLQEYVKTRIAVLGEC